MMDTESETSSASPAPKSSGSQNLLDRALTTGEQRGMVKYRNVTYFLGERNLGTGIVRHEPRRRGSGWPHSSVYVCPKCGSAWGRVQVELSGWLPRSRLCSKHGPGLLFPSDPWGQFTWFPLEMLRNDIFACGDIYRRGATLDSYAIVGDNP
jgi:hypothetical protein